AILLRNGREFAESILAAQKIGVVACPLNTWARTKELRDSLESIDPRALVFDARQAEQLGGVDLEGLPAVVVGDRRASPIPAEPYEEVLAAAADDPPPPFTRRRGSSRVVIHPSGTTGRPKGPARDAPR